MVKKLLVLLLLLSATGKLFSQIDSQFWFVAPDISAQHGDSPIYIRLSSMNDPVNFQLTMPANPAFVPITGSIGPNTTFSITLTAFKSQIENSPPDQVLNKGLLLTTDKVVTAYYEEASTQNPAIFSLKGQNGLGLEFYIVSQNTYPNQSNLTDAYESFEIVATEDNTTVTITPTDNIQVGRLPNVPFTITLNRGETYSARSTHQATQYTLSGSHIVANKPIAVTWSDDSIITGGWDVVGDQLVPVTIIGLEYIAIKGYASNTTTDNDERVYITATADNTALTIDGTFIQNLIAGQTYNYAIPPASATAYIQTSAPAYVMHLSGFTGEAGSSLLPQIFCTGSRQISFTRTSGNNFSLMILTMAGNEGAFLMDGQPNVILATDFAPVPGTGGNWVYCRKAMNTTLLPVSSHVLTNSLGKFHLGIINMLGGSAEYGYFSYFSSINLGVDQTVCPGTSVTLDGGPDWTTYLWEMEVAGVWTTVGAPVQTLVVTTPGHYRCSVTGQNCALQDDMYLFNYPVSEPVITGAASLCENTPGVSYSATANFAPYIWSVTGGNITTGQGSPAITVDWPSTGNHTVTLDCINQYGCPVQKTYPVVVNPLPVVTYAQPAAVCADALPFLLTGEVPAGGTFTGTGVNSGTSFFNPGVGVGSYLITYTCTDASGCIGSDAKSIQVNPLPTVVLAALPPVCISSPPIVLTGGTPLPGTFTGIGVNPLTGTFNPAQAPAGSLITYAHTNTFNCASSAQQFQTVILLPTAQGTVSGDNPVCEADQGSSYSLNNADPLATSFIWSLAPVGSGTVTGTGPACTVNWSSGFSGSAQLIFQAVGTCGTSGLSTGYSILVKSIPTVTLMACNDLKTTKNGKPIVLKGGRPLGTAGIYEGTGVYESPPGSKNYLFYPSDNLVIPGAAGAPYNITYRYTNALGCNATATEKILVYPSNANQPCQIMAMTDVRDGQSYTTFLTGAGASARCWMEKNLDYGTPISGDVVQTDNCLVEKYCAGNLMSQCGLSGGLYQWDELMRYGAAEGDQGLCPPGWHVATKAEWDLLILNNQDVGLAGSFLKDVAIASGFHGLTIGMLYLNKSWSFINGPAPGSFYWTSRTVTSTTALANGLNAVNPSISRYNSSKSNAFSVRCVKD